MKEVISHMLVQFLKKEKFRWLKLSLLYLILSFLLMFPLLATPGFFGGWDQSFHLNRIVDLTANLRHLHPISFINTTAFSQIGLAVNTFYPYLTLLPFAILHLIIPSLTLSVNLGLTAILFTNFICAHIAMTRFTKLAYQDNSVNRPIIFAIAYSLSGYYIFNLIVRFDLGECLVMMILPIFAVGLYDILLGDWRHWYWFVFSATTIAYSHLLSTVIIAFITVIIVLCSFFKMDHRRQRLLTLCKSSLFILINTLFLLIPLIITASKVDVTSPKLGSLSKQAMSGFSAFVLSTGNVINPKEATHGVNLGIIILASILICTICFKRLSKLGEKMYICGMFAFFLCTFFFPWKFFDHTPIRILQHPWRLLIFVNLFMAGCLSDFLTQLNKRTWQIVSLILMITVTFSTIFIYTSRTELKYPTARLEKLTMQTKYMDYEPVKSHSYLNKIEKHQGTIDGRKYVFNERTPLPDGMLYHIPLASHEQKLDVPFLDYGNLTVSVQNIRLPSHVSKRGTLCFSVPANSNSISIHYQTPVSFKIAAAISFSGILFYFYLWFKFRTKE